MKKPNLLIFSLVIIFNNYYSFAESTALNDVLKERSDIKLEAEKNSESLKSLNEEKRLIIDKLLDVNKRYDEIAKNQTKKSKPNPKPISPNEIRNFMNNKPMGRCRITPGEYAGEYIIQKDKVKIRFAFLPANSVLAPKLSVIQRGNAELFQIEQPGYDPSATNLPGEMHSIMRFIINENDTAGEVTHAFFYGQKINDKWFGQSSLDPTPITCVLEKTSE